MRLPDVSRRVNAFCGDDCASTPFLSNSHGAYVPKTLWAEAGLRDAEQRPQVLDAHKEPPGTADGRVCIHEAYKYPRVQIAPDNSAPLITVDIDDADDIAAFTRRAQKLYPSFIVQDQTTGKLHASFVLEHPVHRNPSSLAKPLQKLAKVSDQLVRYYGGDRGYGGRITRNPVNPGADAHSHFYQMLPYALDTISRALPAVKSSYGERQSGQARNVDLFTAAVSEAHRPRWQPEFAKEGYGGSWLAWVVEQDKQMHGDHHLPSGEHRSIAKSTCRYAVRQFSHIRFSDIQRQRLGKRWHESFAFDFEERNASIFALLDLGMKQTEVARIAELTQQAVSKIARSRIAPPS